MIDTKYFQSIPKFQSMQYYFVPETPADLTMYDASSFDRICKVTETDNSELDLNLLDSEVQVDTEAMVSSWDIFKKRPEYRLLHPHILDSFEDSSDLYDILLVGSVMIRAFLRHLDPDTETSRLMHCLEWLRSTDFYVAPSSATHHDNVPQGLVNHSLNVVYCAGDLIRSEPFRSTTVWADAVFSSLVHDWCKIGLYEPYMRNVKDDSTGVWSQIQAYRYKDDRYACLGHGATSMYVASRFFSFSIEIAAAIRWHMGAWNTCSSESNELGQANRQYPLVHLIQFADQLSITNYALGTSVVEDVPWR